MAGHDPVLKEISPLQHTEFVLQRPDRAALYAQVWQADQTPEAVVCLVHGIGEHSGRYVHVAQALTAAGFALAAFDARGHGKSSGPRGHIPSYDTVMDDIAAFLVEVNARYPQQPQFLYGHSLGGGYALNFMLRRRPELKGVIATSPMLETAFQPPAWKLLAGRTLYRLWPAFSLKDDVDAGALSRDPAVGRAYLADPLNHQEVSARLGMDLMTRGRWALDHAADFPPVPLLLVHGSEDRITSAAATRRFAVAVPGECTLKVWDSMAHETHNEIDKEAVLAYLVDWLRAHVPREGIGHAKPQRREGE